MNFPCLYGRRVLTPSLELDEEMLGTSSKQKWKPSASRKDCREAYRQALASMDIVASHVAETSDA